MKIVSYIHQFSRGNGLLVELFCALGIRKLLFGPTLPFHATPPLKSLLSVGESKH